MLTRLKVSGFKNLVDVDVRFGPFTCIAGANGVGKSNLFDAIHFLSALADSSFIEAAQSVRDEEGRVFRIRNLFHRTGPQCDDVMSFEAEMIVPHSGVDDLGQSAKATSTFLTYSVDLAYRINEERSTLGSLELLREELRHIRVGEATKHLLFDHDPVWRTSAVSNERSAPYFISTDDKEHLIKLHQDSKGDAKARGRTLSRLAASLPRTVLSTTNATENPTALLARREMQSWRRLQLEPSALRRSDSFTASPRVGTDGSHLPATLYRLARSLKSDSQESNAFPDVYGQLANRLSELISEVRRIGIDRDESRELLTIQLTTMDGSNHPAQALSDGTLRFLALAILELDPTEQGVLCLEEPENGIHPARIPAILKLLQDIAVDVNQPIDLYNPLRQVIINTHSPTIVQQVPEDSLVVVELKEKVQDGNRFKHAVFGCLPGTWRTKSGAAEIPLGILLDYLNPTGTAMRNEQESLSNGTSEALQQPDRQKKPRRIVDRADLQPYLPLFEESVK
jgi:predicted ATPase